MEKFFKLKENNTTLRTEIMAGLTTFFAMAYIVFVNPDQVAGGGAGGWLAGTGADASALGKIWNAVYIASILGAIVGTLLMGLYAKLPFALACGMGLNAFFCTCFVSGAFFNGEDVMTGYHSGIVIIFISGIIFLLLSVTGLREYIAKAMPDCLKKAIPAGIGLFIAFLGMQNAGLIQANQYTLVQFVNIKDGAWASQVAPALVAFIGFIIIAILNKLRVKGNIIIGIVASTILYYVFIQEVPDFDIAGVGQAFKDFGSYGITGLLDGEAWSKAFTGAHIGSLFNAIMLIVTFCLVDMFDTVGTLYGASSQAGMLDENGDPINVDKAMTADSVGTVAGAAFGTSTVTTFVESASGVAAGGRTGLTALVTGLLFLLSTLFAPLFTTIPSFATAPALIFVGFLMFSSVTKIDLEDDLTDAIPAYIAIIAMPLCYSISEGISLGIISYVILKLCTGKAKKVNLLMYILAVLFILKYIFL